MDYFDFEKDFKRRLAQLKLPAGTAQVPLVRVITPPLEWTVELFLRFPDNMHVRAWEYYAKIAGLHASRRHSWAYHYGPTDPKQIAPDGTLTKGTCTDPLVIRIDTADGLHLHFNAQEPHYGQAQVNGLVLDKVDFWTFIKGILRHRQSGKGVDQVFGFKIKT